MHGIFAMYSVDQIGGAAMILFLKKAAQHVEEKEARNESNPHYFPVNRSRMIELPFARAYIKGEQSP